MSLSPNNQSNIQSSTSGDVYMQSESDVISKDDQNVYPSAYTAPAHPRPQAAPHHSMRGRQDGRGDLTADNLERIPEADHVAPGIRLETVGNDHDVEHDRWEGENVPTVQEPESVDRIVIDGRGRLDGDSMQQPQQQQQQQSTNLVDSSDGMLLEGDRIDSRFGNAVRAPSSMALSGRSSTGAIDHDGSEGQDYRHEGVGEDDMVDYDDDVDDDDKELVHERVGGSGATAENASKGTSVGHFGPRGEAIPGVPPHLDPRQPHFRPPSPSAASVLSVAVQPPVSPKLQASAGLGLPSVNSTQAGSNLAEVVDSGEETESFDNGAMTPTLSDDFPEDDTEERVKLPSEQFETQGSKSGSAFGMQRMNLDSDDITPSTSVGGPYQVSFSPVVTSHHRGSVSGYSGRAPSIAATAGSSRAPSTRGLSPPASTSRAGTTEGSSVEEFESTGTGLDGDGGAETPSVGRSRRSSYSAPSSEVDNGGLINDDVNNRARGGTLVPSSQNSTSNPGIPEINTSAAAYAGSGQGDMGEDGGPSLAPSEAGSDSTRSMTYDSSVGHGGQAYGGLPFGHASASTDRLPSGWSSVANVNSSPALFEPYTNSNGGGNGGGIDLANTDALLSTGMSPSNSGFKGPHSSSGQPMLPSLLAIKRASRRQDSGPASTAATAGTASPASSLSIDGDFDEPPGGYPTES